MSIFEKLAGLFHEKIEKFEVGLLCFKWKKNNFHFTATF
jgi:hypothetical protein